MLRQLPSNTSGNSSMPIDLTTTLQKIEERLNRFEAKIGSSGEPWIEEISKEPRAFVYHNFLTNEECEHLINLAKPNMERSKVFNTITQSWMESSTRTSTGTYLRRGHDKIVEEIEKRISDFTFMPIENGKELYVLQYEVGQQNEPHYDLARATFLMYLSDVEEGGETYFPLAKGSELSKCGEGELILLPKKRDALLFLTARPDGTRDPSSVHAGCPVTKGNKWACIKSFDVNEDNPLHNRLPNTIKRSTGKVKSLTMKKTKKRKKDKDVVVKTEKKRRAIDCKKCGQGCHNSQLTTLGLVTKEEPKQDHGEALTYHRRRHHRRRHSLFLG